LEDQANVAESQPAAAPVAAEAPQLVSVDDLNPRSEEYRKWQSTGELPAKEITPLKEEPAPSTEAQKAEPSPKSDPGESPESDDKYGPGAQKRIKQLLARAKKAEEALAASARDAAPKGPEKTAESSAPAAEIPTLVAPERPKRASFDSDEKYEDALFDWRDKHREYEASKAAAERQKTEIEQQNAKVLESWKARVEKSKESHDDFETVAFAKDLPIPYGSPVDEWVLQSEVGAEMLYHLGSNRDELKRINALSRPAQHRELSKLEEKLLGTPEEKQPVKEEPKPKAKVVTDALPPPRDVGGRFTAAADEEEAALKKDDVGRYIELANEKDLARRRAGHR
jgi:hypothetical protein